MLDKYHKHYANPADLWEVELTENIYSLMADGNAQRFQ